MGFERILLKKLFPSWIPKACSDRVIDAVKGLIEPRSSIPFRAEESEEAAHALHLLQVSAGRGFLPLEIPGASRRGLAVITSTALAQDIETLRSLAARGWDLIIRK